MRLLSIFLILATLVIVPFLIWGDHLDTLITADWLKSIGPYAWLVGILALVGDLFLPIPSTAVISALGYLYGTFLGGLLGTAGSFLSGSLAYTLCRHLGHRAAVFIAGEHDLGRGQHIFAGRPGGWIIALSRWLPIFPEVLACMAGLVRMPAQKFYLALACGSAPLGFTFAAIGATGQDNPSLALTLSAVIPAALYLVASKLRNKFSHHPPARD